jgi:N-acetyl-gamma-glutamyl-phosphate reductase
MPAKLKVAVLGATGYSGLELTRLLLRHPQVEKPVLLRRSADPANGQVNLADIFPALSGNGSYPLQPLSWSTLKQQDVKLLFLATPHEVSRALVPEAVAEGIRVVDLSGARRGAGPAPRHLNPDEDAATAPNSQPKPCMDCQNERRQDPQRDGSGQSGCYATTVTCVGPDS